MSTMYIQKAKVVVSINALYTCATVSSWTTMSIELTMSTSYTTNTMTTLSKYYT